MLVLIILLPCLILGGAVVVFLDRRGVLSGWDSSSAGRAPRTATFSERVPRAGLVAAMACMAAWILAWMVLLIVGLNVIAS